MAMWFSRLLLLVLAYASISVDAANNTDLVSDVARFIPDCAQPCVQSFVRLNYPDCTDTNQLSCVCTSPSVSTYTIGEGALQCMTGEVKEGACAGAAQPAVDQFVAAYQMCSGLPNALNNTHTALTATLETNPTESGHLQLAVATTTSSSTTSTTSSTATPTTTTTTTSLNSTTTTTTSPTATATDSDSKKDGPAAPDTNLTTPQIAGIAAGAGAGLAIALGIIAWLLCCRKRNKERDEKERESEMFGGNQADPTNRVDSGYRALELERQREHERQLMREREHEEMYGQHRIPPPVLAARKITHRPEQRTETRPGRPPRPPTLESAVHDAGYTSSPPLHTGTIGLAISELNGSNAARHQSRQASFHGGQSLSRSQSSGTDQGALGYERRSVASTIEEEPESPTKSTADSWGKRSGDRILSRLSLGVATNSAHLPPPAALAAAAAVGKKNGNPSFLITSSEGHANSWQTATTSTTTDSSVSRDAYPAPLTLSKDFSQDPNIAKPSKALDLSRFPAPPPIPADVKAELQRSNTLASSYYGTEASSRPVSTLPPQHRAPPESLIPGRQHYKNPAWEPRHSTDSVTTVTTMESTVAPRTSHALSPVKESPSSYGSKATDRRDVFGFPREPVDVKSIDTSRPLTTAEIAALRAMRLRQQQGGLVGSAAHGVSSGPGLFGGKSAMDVPPLTPDLAATDPSSSSSLQQQQQSKKKRPSDLRVDTLQGNSGGNASRVRERPREERRGLAELTPTRKGDALYLKVQ